MKNIATIGLALMAVVGVTTAFLAADKKPATGDTKTTVNSGHFRYSLKLGQAIYTTNVVVIDPSIDIFCDKMTVFFAKKKAGAKPPPPVVVKPKAKGKQAPLKPLGGIGGNVDRIVCEGNVIIVKKDEKDKVKASGKRAVYTSADERIVITGNAHLENKNISVLGKVIVYDRRTGDLEAAESTVSNQGTGKDEKKPSPKGPGGR